MANLKPNDVTQSFFITCICKYFKRISTYLTLYFLAWIPLQCLASVSFPIVLQYDILSSGNYNLSHQRWTGYKKLICTIRTWSAMTIFYTCANYAFHCAHSTQKIYSNTFSSHVWKCDAILLLPIYKYFDPSSISRSRKVSIFSCSGIPLLPGQNLTCHMLLASVNTYFDLSWSFWYFLRN